jgi:hypothetical protein
VSAVFGAVSYFLAQNANQSAALMFGHPAKTQARRSVAGGRTGAAAGVERTK